ncbi:MAG: alpha/beta hydrolase, partial [Thermomicrobiales bacterium]|nr:alpha/beta hydrolase [Thermomicrobiales bacterium]
MFAASPKTVLQSVTLRNGTTMPFVEQGDQDGVPVILVHGYPDSWFSFERLLPHLPSALHTFAISQRGHSTAALTE